MNGKVLIVEDEPVVALDLQQEIEDFGCEVVGLAESADEALLAVEETRPDLAMMDIRITGSMDGIEAARLLRDTYGVPVIFLTSYSDDTTISRATREMPYGYLTKPFQTRELKAMLQVALHKAEVDAGLRTTHRRMAATVNSMTEALLMVTPDGDILFMNAAAEHLTGRTKEFATNRRLAEVVDLRDRRKRPIPILNNRGLKVTVQEFGLTLINADGAGAPVDLTVSPLADDAGGYRGFVVNLRRAEERIRAQEDEGAIREFDPFEEASVPMLQLDATGHVMRVNHALMEESGIAPERLIGRTIAGLANDTDPRIAQQLMQKLLHGDASVSTGQHGMH
jgi:PAS domain S-box-containing protein